MKIPIGTLCIIIKTHIRHNIIGRECEVIGYDEDRYVLDIPAYPAPTGFLYTAYRNALLPITPDDEILREESEKEPPTFEEIITRLEKRIAEINDTSDR